MLNSFKSKAPDKDQGTVVKVPLLGTVTPPPRPVVEPAPVRLEPATKAGTISSIGTGMSIVGTIDCNGPAQVFGRIEGEVRASDLLVGDGAHIDGNIIAQDVTICGHVKGTVRAVRVKLQAGGAVEGDIFHKTLSIDESALFEGSSRRVENPTEHRASIVEAKPPQKKGTVSVTPTLPPLPPIDGDLPRR
jgi:cytoskeletal protein CcmA (bactofilin family)